MAYNFLRCDRDQPLLLPLTCATGCPPITSPGSSSTWPNDYSAAVWNDARRAVDCPAIDAWRMARRTGGVGPHASPQQDCPDATFGNSDSFGGSYTDPTP